MKITSAKRIQVTDKPSIMERVDLSAAGMYPIPDEEAEMADLRVCSTDRYFSDDVEGTCENEGCGRTIYHRPYGPTQIKKVCLHCAMLMTQAPQA